MFSGCTENVAFSLASALAVNSPVDAPKERQTKPEDAHMPVSMLRLEAADKPVAD